MRLRFALTLASAIISTSSNKKDNEQHGAVKSPLDCGAVVVQALEDLEATVARSGEEDGDFAISFASPLPYLKKFQQHSQEGLSSQEATVDDGEGSSTSFAKGFPSPRSLPADLVECATQTSHVESIKLAADLSLYGLYGIPVNTSCAFPLIQSLMENTEVPVDIEESSNEGTSSTESHEHIIKVAHMASFASGYKDETPQLSLAKSYRKLGLMYATGVGVKRDYAQALVYASLAAMEGDLIAHQLLGYWYHAGIGVPRNCAKSVWHYQRVADAIKDLASQDPSGSRKWPKAPFALDKNGLYGKGASGSGNPAIHNQKKDNSHISEADLLLVYKLQADAGDAASQFMLGQTYYLGNSATLIDYGKALLYLTKAAAQYPAHVELDGGDDSYKTAKLAASNAAGYLGIMYARGEGVPVDLDIARQWFERGVQQENALSHTWLGRMYLRGIGVDQNYDKGKCFVYIISFRDASNPGRRSCF